MLLLEGKLNYIHGIDVRTFSLETNGVFFWNNDQLSAESPLIESILVCFPKLFVFIHLQQSL